VRRHQIAQHHPCNIHCHAPPGQGLLGKDSPSQNCSSVLTTQPSSLGVGRPQTLARPVRYLKIAYLQASQMQHRRSCRARAVLRSDVPGLGTSHQHHSIPQLESLWCKANNCHHVRPCYDPDDGRRVRPTESGMEVDAKRSSGSSGPICSSGIAALESRTNRTIFLAFCQYPEKLNQGAS
jgi:hypothetical protein